MSTHLHRIRSYEKLTTEGNHFLGSDLHALVDEVLPGRFGGAPTDYQLVEEEVRGLPKLSVVVGPRIGEVAEDEVLSEVLGFLRQKPRNRLMADVWAQGDTLRVVRREPQLTPAGRSCRSTWRRAIEGAGPQQRRALAALLPADDLLPALELRRRRDPGGAPGARARRPRPPGDRGLLADGSPDPLAQAARPHRASTPASRWCGSKTMPLSLTGTYSAGRPFRARPQLEAVLDRDFDVIHFHNPSLLGAPALLGMGRGIKLYTAHEQWLLCPSHVLWKRSGRVCERPPCRSCELEHLRPPQLWRRTSLLERSLPHLDALIAPSRDSAALHERFASLTRIEVINHFVPPAPPPNEDEGEAGRASAGPQRPYFLYVGRLEPIKGVRSLIEAFRRRRSQDLVIAGDGGLQAPVEACGQGPAACPVRGLAAPEPSSSLFIAAHSR